MSAALSLLRDFVQAATPSGYTAPSSSAYRTDGLGPLFERAVVLLNGTHGAPSTVVVRFDRVYGKVVCYPVSPRALVVAKLAGTKTLRPRDLVFARELGLQITLAPGSVEALEAFLAEAP